MQLLRYRLITPSSGISTIKVRDADDSYLPASQVMSE
jgi:hypothetical protein